MKYEIDIDSIIKDYAPTGSFIHKPEKEYNIFPYVTNTKKDMISVEVNNFDNAIGQFSRIITKSKLLKEFNVDAYKKKILDEIKMDIKNRSIMLDLISNLFFSKENLSDFHPRTLNYKTLTTFNKKLGQFLADILYVEDNEINLLLNKIYNDEPNNILLKIMVSNLDPLEKNKKTENLYKCLIPYIKNIFMEDLKWLIRTEDEFINNVEKLLKFYYLFYVCQVSLKLNNVFREDEEPYDIYFGLDWENISKGRECVERGWNLIESNVLRMFSHANTLDIINHNKEGKKYSYLELKYRLEEMTEEEKNDFIEQVNNLIETYKSYWKDGKWNEFKFISKFEKAEEDIVYKLYCVINHQFEVSGRKARQTTYGTWFVEFCKKSFLRLRGRYGLILNLNEEYIIFLTKICIKNEDKIKVKLLFEEFKKRGVMLDNESKQKLIQLYERLNILEKKSDSGDAQYVRRIL